MQLQQHLVIRAILYIFPLSLHDNMFLVNFNLFVVMIHSVFQGEIMNTEHYSIE